MNLVVGICKLCTKIEQINQYLVPTKGVVSKNKNLNEKFNQF